MQVGSIPSTTYIKPYIHPNTTIFFTYRLRTVALSHVCLLDSGLSHAEHATCRYLRDRIGSYPADKGQPQLCVSCRAFRGPLVLPRVSLHSPHPGTEIKVDVL